MIRTATRRRLGPWLAALYVAAQVFGVVPLISCHSAHASPGALMLPAREESGIAHPQGDHHFGDADDAAHHHALQDLNGVLAWAPHRNEIALVRITVRLPAPRTLAEADPVLLERPPKPFLSI